MEAKDRFKKLQFIREYPLDHLSFMMGVDMSFMDDVIVQLDKMQ